MKDATRSGKGNQPLYIKTAVQWPFLKLGLQNFRLSFYFVLILVASLLFRCILMTSHINFPALQGILKVEVVHLLVFELCHKIDLKILTFLQQKNIKFEYLEFSIFEVMM